MTSQDRIKIGIAAAIVVATGLWIAFGGKKKIADVPDAAPVIAAEPSATPPVVVVPIAPLADASLLSPECAALEAANRSIYTPLAGCAANGFPSFACATLGDSTWAFRIRTLKIVSGACDARYELAAVRSVDGGTLEEDAGTVLDAFGLNELTVHPLIDYDGDGNDEVMVEQHYKTDESALAITWRVLTVKNGQIQPYAPATKITIAGFEDIDADGKPDLLTRGPFGAVEETDSVPRSWPVAPAWFAHHARPDGTFAVDVASQAFALKKCPAKPTLALTGDRAVDGPAIVCAKLWNVPVAEVTKAIRTACPDPDAYTDFRCQEWELPLARIAAPFTLR